MTFKMMIAACWLGMALLLQIETGLGQAKVQDISAELWQKLPKDYGLFDCGFIPKMDKEFCGGVVPYIKMGKKKNRILLSFGYYRLRRMEK